MSSRVARRPHRELVGLEELRERYRATHGVRKEEAGFRTGLFFASQAVLALAVSEVHRLEDALLVAVEKVKEWRAYAEGLGAAVVEALDTPETRRLIVVYGVDGEPRELDYGPRDVPGRLEEPGPRRLRLCLTCYLAAREDAPQERQRLADRPPAFIDPEGEPCWNCAHESRALFEFDQRIYRGAGDDENVKGRR